MYTSFSNYSALLENKLRKVRPHGHLRLSYAANHESPKTITHRVVSNHHYNNTKQLTVRTRKNRATCNEPSAEMVFLMGPLSILALSEPNLITAMIARFESHRGVSARPRTSPTITALSLPTLLTWQRISLGEPFHCTRRKKKCWNYNATFAKWRLGLRGGSNKSLRMRKHLVMPVRYEPFPSLPQKESRSSVSTSCL